MSASENEPPREGGDLTLTLLFAVYQVLLVWIVLWKLELPWVGGGALRQIKLVPFLPGGGAGASTPFEVAVNFALFIPFGLYLGLLAPLRQWWTTSGAALAASLALEVAQYAFAIGSSDVTDVVVNTAGALAGLGLLALARRKWQFETAAVMKRLCSIGTGVALLAIVMFIVSPVRYDSE